MPKKSKAGGSARKTSKAQTDKAQSERFIETARAIGVDEGGKEFRSSIAKILPSMKKRR